MNQFILIINGPIGAGKTQLINSIVTNYKKIFVLSANKIKFMISDYTPDRDRDLVQECLLLVADKMLENGMSLILEGGSLSQGKFNKNLIELGEKHGIKAKIVNIEAPIEVLKKRFEERVSTAAERGSKLSVTDDAGFMQRYGAYQSIRDEAEATFDSSTHSPDELAKQIMALV